MPKQMVVGKDPKGLKIKNRKWAMCASQGELVWGTVQVVQVVKK